MIEVVSWSELVRRAGTPARARTLVRAGAFRPVLRGAYVNGAEDESSPLVRVATLRHVLPPDVAVSHRAALWVLGEDVLDRGQIDVTVPRGRHLEPRPWLRPHTAHLRDDELALVRGQLCVSAARSVVDVARTERLAVVVAFGDRALRSGAATPYGIQMVLERAGGLRGVRRAREAVSGMDGRSESWPESLLRVALQAGGVRHLDVQYDVYDVDGHVGRADLHVDGVWVEFDGRAARLLRPVFVAERRRQTRVLELCFELRRFTYDDLVGRGPASLAGEVFRAVALAAGRDRSRALRGPDTLRPPRLTPLPTLAQSRRSA